jgi:sugar transferase (PEP-CTERM system associated)
MRRISRTQLLTQMKISEATHKRIQEEPSLLYSFFHDRARAAWRAPGFRKRLLILGTGQLAVDLSQVIRSKPWLMFDVVGFLDEVDERVGEPLVKPFIIGTYDQLGQVVLQYHVDTIVVCLAEHRMFLPVQALLDFKTMGVNILDGHHLFETASGRLLIDTLRPSTLIFSTGFRRGLISLVCKRLFDVVVSALGLVALTPLFLLIAALIRVDSPGPILFRQFRVGLRGHPFLIWKFRSMQQDAEKFGPRWAQANDPRISRVGWWLRKTRLDELPQLVNVLRGEMSLVGPRPERPEFVRDLRSTIPYYDIRHTVRPGITGWAQVRFRYGASAEDAHTKLQYDLFYVKRFSLALDFQILLETIHVVMFGKGAH